MAQYYHKPVILLLDEYDVPIAKADSKGYYDQMLEIISPLLGTVLKDNEFLKFAVITGCLLHYKGRVFLPVPIILLPIQFPTIDTMNFSVLRNRKLQSFLQIHIAKHALPSFKSGTMAIISEI